MNESLKLLKKRLSTRSFSNSLTRVRSIVSRYGIDGQQFKKSLHDFVNLVNQYNIQATLPVTAIVVEKHPNLFQWLQDMGMELAVHGYTHIDYSDVDNHTLESHIKNAQDIFHRHEIRFKGYRYPYLRKNDKKIEYLSNFDFDWDSSQVIAWNQLKKENFREGYWADYQKILRTYQAQSKRYSFSLPYFINRMVEIPVSVPDDDMLVERLHLSDDRVMYSIWDRMLDETIQNNEMTVLQVHPERFGYFRFSFEYVLNKSVSEKSIWTACLGEIADWWKERSHFSFQIAPISENCYHVKANRTKRATVLAKNIFTDRPEWIDHYTIATGNEWKITSTVKPIIGVSQNTSNTVIAFLTNEGFPYEISNRSDQYGYYVNHDGNFSYQDQCKLLQNINHSKHPLFRFWRWPNNNKSCFAVTGDIDGVNLGDFIKRFHG